MPRKLKVAACALAVVMVNALIVAKLFGVHYSAYNESIEGTFIAIARVMAARPFDWGWWPLWETGEPFEVTYLPFQHWLVAAMQLATGMDAARSFHIVTAFLYLATAPAMFWMAYEFSRKLWTSFLAALLFSCVSLAAFVVPGIAADAGGLFNLRRLQILEYYGEGPHTCALLMLPIALVGFHRAMKTGRFRWKLLAGVAAACTVLSNAFSLVMLPITLLCWLMAFRSRPWWKAPLLVAIVGVLSFCWVSPWFSPALIRGIRGSAVTYGGDYRYKLETWATLFFVLAGFLALWLFLRWLLTSPYLQFFILLAYLPSAIVLFAVVKNIYLAPQPHRYQLEMDFVLPLALVFTVSAASDLLPLVRAPRCLRPPAQGCFCKRSTPFVMRGD